MIDGMHDGVTDRTRLDAGEFSVDVSSPSIEGLGDGTVLVFENGSDAEGPLAKTPGRRRVLATKPRLGRGGRRREVER